MEGNARRWFTPKQRAELWERWKSGQCVADIARALERRNKSGVYRVLAINGGIAPSPRGVGFLRWWRGKSNTSAIHTAASRKPSVAVRFHFEWAHRLRDGIEKAGERFGRREIGSSRIRQ